MDINITLPGKPVSTNTIYQYTCVGGFLRGYMTKEGKARKEEYGYRFKLARPTYWQTRLHYKVEVKLFFENKRSHDVDNYNKILLDAGSGILWMDDNQVVDLHVTKAVDKSNPRIEVTIHIV